MQDLKNECSKRNLSFMGNKYTLVNRLKGYDSLNKKLLVSTIVKTNTPTPVASSPDAKVMPPTKQVTPPTQKPPDTTAPPAIKPTTPSPAKASPPVEQPQQDIVKVEIERLVLTISTLSAYSQIFIISPDESPGKNWIQVRRAAAAVEISLWTR